MEMSIGPIGEHKMEFLLIAAEMEFSLSMTKILATDLCCLTVEVVWNIPQ